MAGAGSSKRVNYATMPTYFLLTGLEDKSNPEFNRGVRFLVQEEVDGKLRVSLDAFIAWILAPLVEVDTDREPPPQFETDASTHNHSVAIDFNKCRTNLHSVIAKH